MGNLTEYNLDSSDGSTSDLIPIGTYRAEIIESKIFPNKALTGEELKFTFRIIGGEFSDRWVWHQLRLKNPSPKSEMYGRRELSAICAAVRIPRPKDTSDLHGTPLMIDIEIEPEQNGYKAKNKITGWHEDTGSTSEPYDSTEPMPWEM